MRHSIDPNSLIVTHSDPILITGAAGFIGTRLVATLLNYGFTSLRCLVRASSDLTALKRTISLFPRAGVDIVTGNLLSRDTCNSITEGATLIYHLAAGRGVKSYPDAFVNSVVTTRNLLDSLIRSPTLRRILNVSSLTVYSNMGIPRGGLLDESCEVDANPVTRGEAYCYAKAKQDRLFIDYCTRHRIPYTIVRPGVVYGPGNRGITGRVGISPFGFFLHLGGSNILPLTYVDNCAEAIVLAGLKPEASGHVFNVVDDDLPTSREFLGLYKKYVNQFTSFYLPYRLFYLFCLLWEKYSARSQGQLPPVFNRSYCANYWKGNSYSNAKLKSMLGWRPKVSFEDAAMRYCAYQRQLDADNA
jgi:nucleoside-diphosphate-sugar epimerase